MISDVLLAGHLKSCSLETACLRRLPCFIFHTERGIGCLVLSTVSKFGSYPDSPTHPPTHPPSHMWNFPCCSVCWLPVMVSCLRRGWKVQFSFPFAPKKTPRSTCRPSAPPDSLAMRRRLSEKPCQRWQRSVSFRTTCSTGR